eukprot:3253940-Rhodomonas_salina.1
MSATACHHRKACPRLYRQLRVGSEACVSRYGQTRDRPRRHIAAVRCAPASSGSTSGQTQAQASV